MPYGPGDAYRHTHKARSAVRDRQWRHVIDSAKAEGKSEGAAIRMANGVVKKQVAHDKRAAEQLYGKAMVDAAKHEGQHQGIRIGRRQGALGTLLVGGLAGGGLYAMHKHKQRQKAAAEKTALPALGAIGKGLMSAVKSPGVMKRVGIGAGVGAIGGAATTGQDGSMVGRAIGGAALGAAGGALSSGNFRSSAMRAIQGKPAGRVFATGGVNRPAAAAKTVTAAQIVKFAAPILGGILKTPGLAGRAIGGAAVGAAGGYMTRPEGSNGMGRAVAGGVLGAGLGAASSKAFRGNVSRAMSGRPVHGTITPARTVVPAPTAAFRAGQAVHAVKQVPEQIATVVRNRGADFAAASAGQGLAGAGRARAAAAAQAKAEGPLATRLKNRLRAAFTRSPKPAPNVASRQLVAAPPAYKPPAGGPEFLPTSPDLKVPPAKRAPGSSPGAGSPASASEKLRAHADTSFARSTAGRVSAMHGLSGAVGPTIG